MNEQRVTDYKSAAWKAGITNPGQLRSRWQLHISQQPWFVSHEPEPSPAITHYKSAVREDGITNPDDCSAKTQ